jgi:DNA-binding NarL/FixJ family response regulator
MPKQRDLRVSQADITDFCPEDVESIPEILQSLLDSNRIDLVLDWLDSRGIATKGRVAVDAIRILIDRILKARKGEARLEAECCAIALGLCVESGDSYAEIGRRWGISRQSVEKRVQNICAALKIRSTTRSKSKASSKKYSAGNYRHPRKADVVPFATITQEKEAA